MNPSRPLPVRFAAAIKGQLRRASRPLLTKVRDWQAPRLHRFMMHGASIPAEPTRETAVVIAPHADDETFGCGGVIALKRLAGIDVDVVVLTDGRQSHGDDPTVDPQWLVQKRRQETFAATSALGVPPARVHFFDLPDQGLRRLDPARRSRAVDALAGLLASVSPGEVYICHRNDRHPDHEAAFVIVVDAIAASGVDALLLQYPIWLIWHGPARRSLTPPDLAGAIRVDIAAVRHLKQQAIEAYTSQLPTLPDGFLQQFTGEFEVFFS